MSQVTWDSCEGTSLVSPPKTMEAKRKYTEIENEEDDAQVEEESSSSDGENSEAQEERQFDLEKCGSTFSEGNSPGVDGEVVPLDTEMIQDVALLQSKGGTKDKLIETLQETIDQMKKEHDQTNFELKVANARIEEYIKILKSQNLFLTKEEASLIVSRSKKKIFRYIKIVTNDMQDDTQYKKSVRVKLAMKTLLPEEDEAERMNKWIIFKQYVIRGLKDQAKYVGRSIKDRFISK